MSKGSFLKEWKKYKKEVNNISLAAFAGIYKKKKAEAKQQSATNAQVEDKEVLQ